MTFDLSPRDLSAVSMGGRRKVMAGDYRVFVGSGQPDAGVQYSEASFTIGKEVDLPR